jgi:pimeloyl-ACP methyl ester carboxylesterase
MPSLEKITIAPNLTFDALAAGDSGAPLVLLLHGFAESMHCWRAQVAALAAAGYRAVAPSQRGYSPGARPDTAEPANYHIERLMDDAMAIVAASGYGDKRFHLVGHDWGGSIAWALADRFPERLASLTVLSRPHPNAFNRALQMPDGEQAQRSKHHRAFLEPDAADVVLEDDAKWLRPIRVPTLYIWGDADDTVGRTAAEGTVDLVAAPYRFEVFPGVGHFAADQAPDRVSELLLEHVAAYPA